VEWLGNVGLLWLAGILIISSSILKPEPITYSQLFTPSSGADSDSECKDGEDGEYSFNMVALMEARRSINPVDADSQLISLWEWYGLVYVPSIAEGYKKEEDWVRVLLDDTVKPSDEGLLLQALLHYSKRWLKHEVSRMGEEDTVSSDITGGKSSGQRGGAVAGAKTLARTRDDFGRFLMMVKEARKSSFSARWCEHLKEVALKKQNEKKGSQEGVVETENGSENGSTMANALRSLAYLGDLDGDYSDADV
jgi:hypothetical protein